MIRLGCVVVSAVAPLAVLSYLLLGVFEAQSRAEPRSGARWAGAFEVAVPAAAVELAITVVVLLFAKAVSNGPASRSAHVVAVAVAAVCASVRTSFLVGAFSWPVVLLACAVPAALAAPVFMPGKRYPRI
ncbi:hypothetical protein [Streptomyces sp. MK5]|uniref:hypothetical protein n=1 Tax=Streptomyces sp. MK5 TaxID=3064253 RepID=UPI0027409969|nr:hypothetical protein [Streptomyces sp. MK5]